METKTMTKILITFSNEDLEIIDRIITDRFGSITISDIMDEISYMFDWYRSMFSVISKVRSGMPCSLDISEANVLIDILCTAYNDDKEPEKAAIKRMCDTLGLVRNNIQLMNNLGV